METSPLKTASEELLFLRASFRESVEVFATKVEGEMMRVHECILIEEKKKKGPSKKVLADARDMVTVMRTLEVKPEKGRRRDLKRFETAVEELRRLVDSW